MTSESGTRADAAGEIASAIKADGIVAVLRGEFSPEEAVAIGEVLHESAVAILEVALTGSSALRSVELLRERLDSQLLVGAGTVRSVEELLAANAAGAQFAFSPSFNAQLLDHARELDFLYIPGVMTPTEADTAARSGASIVKLFPADALGPAYLLALRVPLPEIEFIPTGGLSADNVGSFAAAGAVAVGIGSALVSGPGQALDQISHRARAIRQAWDTARGRPAA